LGLTFDATATRLLTRPMMDHQLNVAWFVHSMDV